MERGYRHIAEECGGNIIVNLRDCDTETNKWALA
jgi:hypothetical protein